MIKYQKWTSEEKESLKQFKTIADVKKFAKKSKRTLNSVQTAIRRYAPELEIVRNKAVKKSIKPHTSLTRTIVFNNYKSVIVENNSILIEF